MATVTVWQGDPPLPVLTRTHDGMFEWAPGPSIVYRVVRFTSAGDRNAIWDVYFPDGKSLRCTSLRDCRREIAKHYLHAIGEAETPSNP